mgnify:CR=1 FL=1
MGLISAYIAWYTTTFNYSTPQPADIDDPTFHRLWQLGVNVPIPNFHFTYPKKIVKTVFKNITASSSTNFAIQFDSALERDKFKNLIVENLFVLITNNSTKVGEIQQLAGTYANDATNYGLDIDIKTADDFVNSYTGGSTTVEFYTPQIAESWDVDHNLLVPKGLYKGYPVDFEDIDGKLFAQRLNISAGNYNATEKIFETSIPNLQEFVPTIAPNLNDIYYRVGLRYYLKFSSNPTLVTESKVGAVTVKLPGCATTRKMLLNYATGLADRYYLFNSSAFTDWKTYDEIKASASYKKLQISMVNTPLIIGDSVDLHLDDIYLEHSGGAEFAADSPLGCLLMTYAPNREGLTMGADFVEEYNTLANGDKYPNHPFGNPNRSKKHRISCVFEDAPLDIYQKLKILEMWQHNGYNLNLHTHLPEMPEVLTGRMKLGDATKGIFDFKRVSFEFSFMEV